MKKRILSILSVLTCAFAGLGVATLNVDKASAQDNTVAKTYIEDFTYVDEDRWTLDVGSEGSNAKIENGKLTLTNLSPVARQLATLNVPYNNYEMTFTLSDSVCTAGGVTMQNSHYRLSPCITLGGSRGINLGAYYSEDGVIPEGEPVDQVYRSNGALIWDYGISDAKSYLHAEVPIQGKIKMRVQYDGSQYYMMYLYYWNENTQDWVTPNEWPNGQWNINSGTTVNYIKFGFIGASGSYSIDDLTVTSLDEPTTALISQTEKTFDYQTEEYVEFDVSSDVTADTLYGVYVDFGKLQESEYTFSNGKLRIHKQTILDVYAGGGVGDTMQLRVCLNDGSYDVATIAYTNMPSYVLSYYSGETFVTEQTYKPGETVDSLPELPTGKIGWYIDKKKLIAGEYTVLDDARVEALDSTATFDVTFSWMNLQNKEVTRTISVAYGHQLTGDEVNVAERYGYEFVGWDYDGVVEENMKVSAVYRKLEANGSDFTLDFNEGVNENYVNYIDLIYPGGYASIEDDYWYVKNPISDGVLFTEQMYTDFELSMDVVHFANSYFDDWTLCLSFANAEHNSATYYRRNYAVTFHTAIDVNQELFGRSVFFANKTLYKYGAFCGFVDKENCEVWDLEEPYNGKNQMFNSGLSPNGEKVNIKLRVYKGDVSYAYKFASQTDWTEVNVGKFTEDLTGYIGIQFCSDYWGPYSIGVDNVKVVNLAEDCQEISYSIDTLEEEDGAYVYTVGASDAQVNIDLRRQNWIGTNVLVYNEAGDLVKVEDRPVIVEEIYEIGMFVTLDSRKLAKIWDDYSQYVANNRLNIEIEVLTNRDSMRIPVSLRGPEKVSFSYYDGQNLLETVLVDYGSSVVLKAFENVPEGYVFVGWKDLEGNVYASELKAIRNETFTAAFELKEYTVRFMNKDGTPFYSTKVKYGETVELPKINPENLDGYEFVAWIDADQVITGDTDISAEWKKVGGSKGGCGCGSSIGSIGGLALVLTIPALWVALRKKEQE